MKKVESLEELIKLADEKRSVLMPKRMSARPWPAAFVVNMGLLSVYHLLKEGIYLYEPKSKKKTKE